MTLLLFSDQVAPDATAVVPDVSVLLETVDGAMVDVSADYRTVSTVRGRTSETDVFTAGTCQVILSDLNRDYDPSNAAGPYAGNLKPMRGLQVTATWNGTTYPIFTGFVDSFAHAYEGPREGDATCTISATDGFKVLEAADLAASVYAMEVAVDGPVHWWRLDEGGGTVAYDTIGAIDLTAATGDELGAATLVARDPGGSAQIADFATAGFSREGNMVLTGGPLTIEAVVQLTVDGTIAGNTTHVGGSGFGITGALGLAIVNPPGTVTSTGTTVAMDDNAVHHVAGVWNADGTLKWYVDGVDRTVGTPSTAIGSFAGSTGIVVISDPVTGDGIEGFVDEVAIYDYALTPARIVAHAAAVTTPWNNDTPEERLGRVLDAVDWDTALRELDTGTSTLQSAELDMTVLEHAQKVAESDFGVLFITADGTVRFIGRDGLFNQANQATFGDAGGAELGYRTLTPEFTDQLIRNDVVVSRSEGVAQRVQDTDSIDEYLRHSYTTDGLYHDSDTLSRAAAEFIVSEYKDPQRRINNLTVTPQGDPTNLFPQVLGRELLDQITVIDRPPGGGDPNESDLSIEGIAHTVTPMWWETSWNLAPSFGSSGTPPTVWQLEVAGASELGETTRLGF